MSRTSTEAVCLPWQVICELEAQVHHLKEELIQVNSQLKQQLMVLGLLRDEEKQRASQEHQMSTGKLTAEMESMRLDLQRAHTSQMEEAMEKANSRFKHIEEYSNKLAKSTQMVNELQSSITSVREESSRQQLIMDRRLQEAAQRHDEGKRQLIICNHKAITLGFLKLIIGFAVLAILLSI
ncbi:hypothetical protein XELAEV_18046852mg [Xenopus laevis]|uniref:Uncharacterized protein n=1 Tax=Xenopus laevis TaxID=8355 RepID=A0A974H185_XENLA|nr:hypothetical protein XELAEV_18046852mg [Xenopus laevis]